MKKIKIYFKDRTPLSLEVNDDLETVRIDIRKAATDNSWIISNALDDKYNLMFKDFFEKNKISEGTIIKAEFLAGDILLDELKLTEESFENTIIEARWNIMTTRSSWISSEGKKEEESFSLRMIKTNG